MRLGLLVFFILGFTVHTAVGQNTSLSSFSAKTVSLSLPQFNVTNTGVGLRLGGLKLDKTFAFTTYNSITGANDILTPVYTEDFSIVRFEKKASVLLPENLYRGNKIDSFNPYGSDHPGQAVFAGLINLLFD